MTGSSAGSQALAVLDGADGAEEHLDPAFVVPADVAVHCPHEVVDACGLPVPQVEAGFDPKVRSLVYGAAYAPDLRRSLADTLKGYPDPAGRDAFVQDAQGDMKVSDEGIFKHFALDLPRTEQEVVAAIQCAYNSKAPVQPVTHAASRTMPSFALTPSQDFACPS